MINLVLQTSIIDSIDVIREACFITLHFDNAIKLELIREQEKYRRPDPIIRYQNIDFIEIFFDIKNVLIILSKSRFY